MKRILVFLFAVSTSTLFSMGICSLLYVQFENHEELCEAVGKRSAKINACLKKHRFTQLETGSAESVVAVIDLLKVSEHELANNPILKKQFVCMLWLLRAVACEQAKDYAQAHFFCDKALECYPNNAHAYGYKIELFEQSGDMEQALALQKIAEEKGIDLTNPYYS